MRNGGESDALEIGIKCNQNEAFAHSGPGLRKFGRHHDRRVHSNMAPPERNCHLQPFDVSNAKTIATGTNEREPVRLMRTHKLLLNEIL